MWYKFSSLMQVLDLFQSDELLWATEISHKLWKSRVLIHKYLKELIVQQKLKKVWEGPKVKYQKTSTWTKKKYGSKKIHTKTTKKIDNQKNKGIWDTALNISYKNLIIIENNFYKYNAQWILLEWIRWFNQWCTFRWMDPLKMAEKFIKIYKRIEDKKDDCGMLSAKKQFWNVFKERCLNSVYYADQYIWLEFWRGKLAEMTFYAKQSQNKSLIFSCISSISVQLSRLIDVKKYDAIAITPWSIERKNQLLAILKNELKNLDIPIVNIVKYFRSGIPVPQKSLKTREERVQNAKNTIFIDDNSISQYKEVLLIDDFVWSGATLNETAKKMKESWVKKVDGFAFVGNLDLSYEIINEV